MLTNTIFQGLPEHLQDVTAARRPCIQEEHVVMRQRDLPRQRHLAAPGPPHLGDRVVARDTAACCRRRCACQSRNRSPRRLLTPRGHA
jgi:hypothetical protein